jgi:hypothetical protein
VSSPENTLAVEDATVPTTKVRRSTRSLRIVGCLLALVAVAFTSTACSPEMVAKDAIDRYWSSGAPCAERIVDRESNFQAGAVNPSSGTTGLFQIHPTHDAWIRRTYGYAFSEMKDPYKNSRVARGLFAEAQRYYGDGWQPWRLDGRVVRSGGCPA